jgi:hypothetical protein
LAAASKNTKNRQPKKELFLTAYAETGNISEAARIARCDRHSHYKWIEDAEYAKRFAEAKEQAIERLEEIARKRAEKHSDTLLIFLLKSLRPKVYRERREVEHTGAVELTNTEKIIMLIAEERAKVNGNPRLKDIQN